MKNRLLSLNRGLRFSGVIIILLVSGGVLNAQEYPDLFDPVQFEYNQMTVRADLTLIKPDISSPEELKAVLPDTEVILKRKKIDVRGVNDYTWIGSVKKHHQSMVVFTVVDGIISGYINIGGIGYTIESHETLYKITKRMSEFLIPLANDSVTVDMELALTEAAHSQRAEPREDGSVIDVMVLFTKQIQAKYGRDPKELIQNFVDISNEIFENSQIQTRFNLVHFECLTDDEVQEDQDIKRALIHITTPSTTAEKKRVQHKADLVTLLREHMGSDKCGRAWTMSPPLVGAEFKSYGFSVVEVGHSCSQFTFTHELAHNMGCTDDKRFAQSPGAYDYSYGYYVPSVFGTVMSYYQPKIPYFSNPDITYQGYPIGVQGEANNALTINQTRISVANFMVRDILPPAAIEILTTPATLSVPEDGSAELKVRLGAQPPSTVHVSIWRSDGDADINVENSLLIFNTSNWNTDQTVTVTAAPDADTINGQATIRLNGAGLAMKEITAVEVDIGIPPEIIISTETVTVPEGGTASFTVKLSARPSSTVTVTVSKSYGDPDITVQSGASLTFTNDDWYTPKTVILAAFEDDDAADGSAIFKISAPNLIQKEINAVERDNDEQMMSFIISNSSGAVIADDAVIVPECGEESFYVRLTSAPSGTITAAVARIQGDQDITVKSGSSLIFTQTDWNITKEVILQAACDADAIAGSAQIQISAQGAASKYITATEKEYTPPTILTDKQTVFVTEGGTGSFQVKLSSKPYSDITVNAVWESGDPDISVQSGASPIFTTTNWNTYQTIVLGALADADAVAGTAVITLSGQGLATVLISAVEVEPEPVSELVADKSVIDVPEGGSATLGVKFSGKISANVIVTASIVSGDPDISITSGTVLSFTPLTWNDYQYVTLTAANDSDNLEGEAIIRLSAEGYSSKDVTAAEQEKAALVVQPETIVQSAKPLKINEGGTGSFDVKLSSAPAEPVSVTLSITGDPDIRISTGNTLTFTPQNWNDFQTVGASASDDADSINGTAVIQMSAQNYNSVTIYLEEIDKDIPATLKIGNLKVSKGTPISVPLILENTQNIAIQGIDIVITFSESVLDATGITLSGSILESAKYFPIINTNTDGQITVIIYASTEDLFTGSGIVSTMLFNVVGEEGQRTDLTITKADLNEGKLTPQNGSIEILSNAFELAGTIRYFYNNTAVRNVSVSLKGDNESAVITNESGNYHFPAVTPGNYTMTPAKTDDLSGISATDASKIARKAFDEFNCYQRIAADVTMNGDISALDASWVARYSAGLRNCINDDCIDWVFTAAPIGNCPEGAPITLSPDRQYDPLNGSLSNETFIAVRLGDVTGNWLPDSQIPVRTVSKDSYIAEVTPDSQENVIRVPIFLAEEAYIEGIDIVISFNGNLLKAKEASLTGGILDGRAYGLHSNLLAEGKLTLTVYAMETPFRGSGVLAYIVLEDRQSQLRAASDTVSSPVSFSRFDMNESPYPGKFYINNSPVSGFLVKLQAPDYPFALDRVIQILQILSGISVTADIECPDFAMDNRCGMDDVIGMLQSIAGKR